MPGVPVQGGRRVHLEQRLLGCAGNLPREHLVAGTLHAQLQAQGRPCQGVGARKPGIWPHTSVAAQHTSFSPKGLLLQAVARRQACLQATGACFEPCACRSQLCCLAARSDDVSLPLAQLHASCTTPSGLRTPPCARLTRCALARRARTTTLCWWACSTLTTQP